MTAKNRVKEFTCVVNKHLSAISNLSFIKLEIKSHTYLYQLQGLFTYHINDGLTLELIFKIISLIATVIPTRHQTSILQEIAKCNR